MALPPILQNVINRVRSVWSREQKSIEQATELSKGVAGPMGFDAFSVFGKMGMEPIQDYLRIEQDLMTRYLDVTEMEAYPEISVALDTWADECCQFDVLTGRTVWVESDDLQIKKLLNDLLDSHLEIDEDIWSIARALCKYGNVFEEPLLTQEGVIGLNSLAPETVRRFEKGKGLLVGFAQDPRGIFGITVEDVEAVIRGSQSLPPGMQVFEPWEMIHFRLLSRQRPSIYGIGVLEPGRWIWRRLLLLEDAALIYRLSRTPTRWIFYIDVGKLPPSQALGQIRKIKNEFAKQKFVNERGNIDLRYNPLSCLALDTRIPLLDGRNLTLSEIIKEYEDGKEHWVYSLDPETERIVPGRVTQAAVTRRNAELVEVELDNGEKVRCTPDHRFYLRGGTQVQAQNLKPGYALAPLYRYRWGKTKKNEHEYIVHLDQRNHWEATHWMVASSAYGWKRTPGMEVDHIDNNPLNNVPSNLRHITKLARTLHTPEAKAKSAVALSATGKARRNPGSRARKSGQVRVMWNEWWEAFRDWKSFNPDGTPKEFRKLFGPPGKMFVYKNHKVVAVRRLAEREDTGCISVERWHNFAIGSDVFVHNSDENLFIPVVDGKRTTEVDLMATPEWQVMDDINYFRDKLFTAIKVPKAFLAAEEAARSRLLTLQDLSFARSVMRVQRELRVGIRKICKLHLAALGIDPEKVSFDVYMTIPSWAYELSQLEVRNAKAEFAERVRGYLSERAVMKYIFGFSDDEIDAIRSEREEETRRMAELGVEAPPAEKPRRRRARTEGSTMDLPGASRILPRDDEGYSEKQFRILSEQLDEILDANKELASYIDELRGLGRDLRSGMFHKSSSGRTRLVPSFGAGNGNRGSFA